MSSDNSPGYRAERFVAPAEQTFKLPDESSVASTEAEGVITVVKGDIKITFTPQERQIRVSPYGIVNDDRAVSDKILLISSASQLSQTDLWAALYALWLRRNEDDVAPAQLDSAIPNAAELHSYLVHSGLGWIPDASDRDVLLLSRPAFWQSAGSPLGLSWLQDPIPSTGHSASTLR